VTAPSGVVARARVACIQHGDYRAGLALLESGRAEPYFGMRESVRALDGLLAPHEGLVISLDAPTYAEQRGNTRLVGMRFPSRYLNPFGLLWDVHARPVLSELRRFAPTHVLLRSGTALGLRVAAFCREQGIPTLVVLANAVWAPDLSTRRSNQKLMQLLRDPTFTRVYNYKPTACLSMQDYGLDADKCFAYEFGGERQPEALAPKTLDDGADCHLVFAARMVEAKGPLDVIAAVARLRERGVPARATLFGEGELLDKVRARAATLPPGVIATPGQVGNDALFAAFRAATFACVPTHPSFVEGMPMALTEALASRTPVLASDCAVFARSFRDGEGVRLFRARDAEHLAQVTAESFADPARYAALSATTAAAFARVAARRSFEEVIAEWAVEISGRCAPPLRRCSA
jgi:glycosyltransferase involved in cell wall biosynthesis